MKATSKNRVERVTYSGHRLGGHSAGLCNIAEFRHIKAMALHLRDKSGITGVELYDHRRRQSIGQGLRLGIYDKRTIHILTGQLKDVLAIEEHKKRNPKLRVRTGFPEIKHFPLYNQREIDFGSPKNEVIEWAFTHFAINYDYQKLFETLVPLVYADIFGQQINY